MQVGQATAIVQGAEVGTAFAILIRGDFTYFLTAAHVIDRDGYEADALLPNAQRKPADSWAAIYDPKTGMPHDATVLGSPDFIHDVVVLRVRGITPRRPMCIADATPAAAPFFVSSFQENVIQDPTKGVPFDNEHATADGNAGTFPPVQDRPFLFQYNAPEEVGYSGAPLVDKDTGAVIGMVQGSPLVVDPTTGNTVVSSVTRFGVSVDAIRNAIAMAKADDPALGSLPVIVEGDRNNLLPNFSKRGRRLRIATFDQPLNGSDKKQLFAAYAWYDGAIRRAIAKMFFGGGASPELDPETAVYPIDTDIRNIRKLCTTSDNQQATGVIGIRRTLSSAPGMRTLESRVALVSCRGHIVDSADLEPSQMNGGGPTGDQISQYADNLRAALKSLAGPDGTRLANFAFDGLPIGNSERRGFYSVRHSGRVTTIGYSWAEGEAADFSHLYVDTQVGSIDGVSGDTLATLDNASLDTDLDRAGGSLAATYTVEAEAMPTPRPELRAADRCTYLWRLFMKADDEIPAALRRKEII